MCKNFMVFLLHYLLFYNTINKIVTENVAAELDFEPLTKMNEWEAVS